MDGIEYGKIRMPEINKLILFLTSGVYLGAIVNELFFLISISECALLV